MVKRHGERQESRLLTPTAAQKLAEGFAAGTASPYALIHLSRNQGVSAPQAAGNDEEVKVYGIEDRDRRFDFLIN
jgi:hypothetical protein